MNSKPKIYKPRQYVLVKVFDSREHVIGFCIYCITSTKARRTVGHLTSSALAYRGTARLEYANVSYEKALRIVQTQHPDVTSENKMPWANPVCVAVTGPELWRKMT